MNVDSMRKIDKWAGVPLTFLCSIPVLLRDLLAFRRKSKPDVRNSLFIELSEMGSAILVDPAMRKLRNSGKANLFFAIFKDNYKSLELLKTVPPENIFKMRSDGLIHMAMDVINFIFWCRKNDITCVIDLELFSRFTALLTALSGAIYRVGFVTFHDEGMYRGNIINIPVRYNGHVHITINFISLVNAALGGFDNPYPTVPVSKEELRIEKVNVKVEDKERIREKIRNLYPGYKNKRLVLINANASDMLPQRRWLPEYFIEVVKKLLAEFDDILVIATGAPKELEYVKNVVDRIGSERCVNSAGLFEFTDLVPLYEVSTVMLTNDSGPAHFASVTPLKVFVLFGPETPALYGSLGNAENFYLGLPCSPCVSAANHRKTTCLTRPCISGILPEVVFAKLKSYLISPA
jgi:ADP-heptose:LPS heptosyltransferase